MSKIGTEGEDIIGRWSEEKLDLLAQYLEAYSVIMNKQKQTWLRDYYYIDAFSGSVRPRAKDEERYINGSPIRALQTEPKFDGYWFVDVNPQRVERVEKLREDFPNQIIQTYQGNCNDILCNEIIPKIPYSSKKRAFVFLDPYGLQVDWKTVRELADTKTCDIFVNFSIMAVTRLLPRDQKPDPEFVKQIDQVMGNTEWITQIYRESPATQLSLFSNLAEPTLSREKIDPDWLARLYTEQLSSLFPHVSRPVLIRNSTNSVLYALCLASHNPNAIKITNDIFKRHERLKSR
ncbi:MAG: three-Cys-motif partner protein TcmP [Pseudanabaena sp.]